MKIVPFTQNCGVVIEDVNLASLSTEEVSQIRQAFAEHGLVFFRDQTLSPKQHVDFANKIGDIVQSQVFKHLPGHPEIAVVSKEKDQETNIGGGWHTDHSYD